MLNRYKFLLMMFVLGGALLLTACSPPVGNTITTTTTITKVSTVVEQKYDTYTVRKDDSLQKIASKFAVTKEDLAASNNLPVTTVLHVGQKLKIPAPSKPVQLAPLAQHSLFWPTSGKVVRVFAKAGKGGSKGIDIAGGLGQDIKASGDGKVVYSGASLSGFGNMLIIKHSERVVTVYALNKAVFVKDGQLVKAGEKIAEMGSNKQGDVLLHFEVRVDGKPQDPLVYLEKI